MMKLSRKPKPMNGIAFEIATVKIYVFTYLYTCI